MKLLKSTTYYFLLILVAYIPFYRLFQGFLEANFTLSPSINFWLSHWYEPVIIILLFINLIIFIFKRGKFSRTQITAIALLLFALISILFISPTLSRGIEGFRFIMLPTAVFLLATQLDQKSAASQRLIRIYLITAFLAAILGIVERFLPADYWRLAGILSSNSPYWYGSHTVVGLKQSVSFIGGANELASFLLPAFFLTLSRIQTKPHSSPLTPHSSLPATHSPLLTPCSLLPATRYLLLAPCYLIALILTFSRSAIVALFVGLIIYFYLSGSKKVKQIGFLSILSLIIIMAGAYYIGGQGIKDLFTHGASQSQHSEALQSSISEVNSRLNEPLKLFFGTGLGTAGPASMKYSDGLVSESWYFEIFFSLGLVGLAAFLIFFYQIGKMLIKTKESGLLAGYLALLVCSLFLHTLSDNPAVTFTLFAIVGLVINRQHKE